jgi:hypothetical protein
LRAAKKVWLRAYGRSAMQTFRFFVRREDLVAAKDRSASSAFYPRNPRFVRRLAINKKLTAVSLSRSTTDVADSERITRIKNMAGQNF